jgi:stage V sporulation protein B
MSESPRVESVEKPADGAEVRRAGRGGMFVLAAKVFFQLVGLVQQALLPRAIGLAGYGGFSRVFAPSSVVSNVIVFGFTQGVSRTVAGAGEKDREAFRAAYRVHLVTGLVVAAGFLAASPAIAWFQHAPYILVPLMVMAALVAVYGAYAPLVGYLNGKGEFAKQATLDMTAATLRTAGLVGLGYLFRTKWENGVLGSAIGAVLAGVAVMLLALRWTGTGTAPTSDDPRVPKAKPYLLGLVPVMLAQLFTSALMQADISVLGHYLSKGAPAVITDGPEKVADEWVGVYRACQLFAFLPYQLLFSVTQILFPMLAKAHTEGDREAVRRLVSRGSRLGSIVLGLFASVVITLPPSLLAFVYGKDVAARGADALRVLALGQTAFAMLGLATTVLVSLGRERKAMALTATALTLTIAATALATGGAAFGGAQLVAAATAASVSLGTTVVFGAWLVHREAKAFVPGKTALRVFGALAALAVAGRFVPPLGKGLTVVAAVAVAFVYLGALTLTGELGRDDLAVLKGVLGRGKKA